MVEKLRTKYAAKSLLGGTIRHGNQNSRNKNFSEFRRFYFAKLVKFSIVFMSLQNNKI